MKVDLVVPAGFAARPSGGNLYDRRVRDGLRARGWDVVAHEVATAAEVAGVLPRLGGPVLVDSLVGSWAAESLTGVAERVVPLVHMVFGAPGEQELLRAAPAVVVTSDWTRRQLLTDAALDPRRVHVATPGADLARPGRATGSGGELLCVAALVPGKGQDVLLASLAGLTDLDWRCTLVGSTELDLDYVDGLRKAAADAGVTDRVVLAGELDRVADAYAAADLLVLPSRAETYGMVVTEALARAVPVVASAVGGVPEALGQDRDGGRPGMLVRPDDPAALARSLRRWLEDPRLRTWLRRSASARRADLPRWSETSATVARALEVAR